MYKYINGKWSYVVKLKFTNTRTFSENANKEATIFQKVTFFFTVVFCPMIHNIYLKRYCLLTLQLFRFSFAFQLALNLK